MDYQLKGRIALITGSTSGIGLASARMLAGEGAHVIINGRHQEGIDRAITSLKEDYPSAIVSGVVADFNHVESVLELIKQIESVDILVNNVGVFTSQSFAETSDDDWFRLFEVNVMSGVRLSREYLPKMIKRGWGRIINLSSECAELVPEDLIAYSMSKAAIIANSRGLAQCTKGTSVTVNTVMPGSTLSEGAKRFLSEQAVKENKSEKDVADDFFKKVRTTSLIDRFATCDEIAQMITYLSSPLSSATNGAVLKVDGGSVPGI